MGELDRQFKMAEEVKKLRQGEKQESMIDVINSFKEVYEPLHTSLLKHFNEKHGKL